jgi:hypothetical protein
MATAILAARGGAPARALTVPAPRPEWYASNASGPHGFPDHGPLAGGRRRPVPGEAPDFRTCSGS